MKKITNIITDEIDEQIDEIFNESLSLNLSSEKLLDSSCKKLKLIDLKSNKNINQNSANFQVLNDIEKISISKNKKDLQQKKNINLFNTSNIVLNNEENINHSLNDKLPDRCKKTKKKTSAYPKVEALFKNLEKIDVKAYSIKLQVADSDLLDLFDRSQRTRAATLAKVSDYEYYTPCQRIGSFMDFSQTLRWVDLKNIEKHYIYTKNQLGFLQSKHNIITLVEKNFLKNSSENFKDPNSLFHGFLKDEYLLDKYYKELFDNRSTKTYDPYEFLPKAFFTYLNKPKNWNENFTKLVQTSMNNYNKYFNSDKITLNDLESFNEDIKKKILAKIEFKLYEKKMNLIKLNFEEIKTHYYFTLKFVIMQYILRSPYERKRLNIQYYQKQTPPSSIIIANNGSFNRTLYKEWVKNYGNATEFSEKNLFCYDIISTSILDWTETFRHVNLIYLKNIRNSNYSTNGVNQYSKYNLNGINKEISVNFSKNQTTIHLEYFQQIQNFYCKKSFYFLRDIYYRGVILILKKNKFFKMKSDGEGKWTFKGFNKKPNSNFNMKKSVNYNISYNTTINNDFNIKSNENSNKLNLQNINSINSPSNTKPTSSILSAITTNKSIQFNVNNLNKILPSNNTKNPNSKFTQTLLNYENEFFAMDIFDKIEDFFSNYNIDDFPDIRLTYSYFLFLAKSNIKNIDMSKYIYDQYDDSSKLKLNNSTTTLVNLFFRQLIEKSVQELVNFILSFKLIDDLITDMNKQFLINNPNYNFEKANQKILSKDFNYLLHQKNGKEILLSHGNNSNNSSNRNITNVNIINLNNPNLNPIAEMEKFEKSFRDHEGCFDLNDNFNNNHSSNFNYISNNNNVLPVNNNNHNSVEFSKSGTSKNFKQINIREQSSDVTIKTSDTGRTKDFNYLNINNNLIFPHYEINNYINYKENDIKLPLIKSFVVSDILYPVMHISTKLDNIHSVLKLEYSYDQVSETFINICDNIINLFNGLYSTHFLDFKTIFPSEVEKIKKAHWNRINEVFFDKLDRVKFHQVVS